MQNFNGKVDSALSNLCVLKGYVFSQRTETQIHLSSGRLSIGQTRNTTKFT
jgi:hypothetical protein